MAPAAAGEATDDSALLARLDIDWGEIESEGWTVVKGVVPPEVCQRARRLVDGLLGPPAEVVTDHIASSTIGLRKAQGQVEDPPWPGPQGICDWSGVGPRPPEVATHNYRHTIRHPIYDEVMAELVTDATVAIHRRLLRTESLRLTQQAFVRSDYDPPARAAATGVVVDGWHIDHAFLAQQYESTPRAVYYSSMIALSTIESGGAPLVVQPGSLAEGKAEAARILAAEPCWCAAMPDDHYRTELSARVMPAMSDSVGSAHEVLCDEGDIIILNPMCLHSASPMCLPGRTRHVVFNTFIDASSTFMLLPERGATRPASKFSPELRTGLAARGLESLIGWAAPLEPADTQRRRYFGTAAKM